jgi:N,N'-diacetyllegionaminate synthase
MSTIIIAEAGVNHNGSLELARSLIKEAAIAGADYIKFQTFKTEKLVSKKAKKAEYQKKNINDGDNSQFTMLKKLEIPLGWYPELITYAKDFGIKFLSTAFDNESIDFLDQLEMPFFKIPSGEITNKPYLRHIASKGKPVILSTGMATIPEVMDAIEVLTKNGIEKKDIVVLHCTTEYPTPMKEVNLKAMQQLKEKCGTAIGYSDHTQGIEVPIAAVTLGATVIEKHFTTDRTLPGPDHLASLEPSELKAMVSAIRNIEQALGGSGIKEPSAIEIKNMAIARKSIVAACKIRKGELFTEANLDVKRPGNGISPMLWDNVIGQQAKRDFDEEELIEL